MSTTSEKTMDLQQSSEALLRQARDAINGVDEFFREQGVEPATIRRVTSELMTDDIAAEISEQFNEIQHEISRNVSQKRLEANTASVGVAAGAAKRTRPMV